MNTAPGSRFPTFASLAAVSLGLLAVALPAGVFVGLLQTAEALEDPPGEASAATISPPDVQPNDDQQAEKLPREWATFRGGPLQQGLAGTTLPEQPTLAWRKPAPDGVTATAAIVKGRVYVGTLGGRVWCLDLADGEELWTFENPLPENSYRPGFNAAPAVAFGLVVLGDEDGIVHAFDQTTGEEKWTHEADGEIDAAAMPVTLAAGESFLVGSHGGSLVCLDAADGQPRWTYTVGDRISCSTAIAAGRTFIAGCDGELHIVDIETGQRVGGLPLGSPTLASPSLRAGRLFVATQAGAVQAIDLSPDGPEAIVGWAREFGGDIRSSTAVTDAVVIVGSRDKRLRALSLADGSDVWTTPARSRIDSSPVVAGDRVYFGSNDRTLYAADLATGEIVWEYKVARGISASPALAEGHLVIGVEGPKGELLCFE